MLTRISELHPSGLRSLTPRCSRCSLLAPGAADVVTDESGGRDWPEAAEAALGFCGVVATVDGRAVGYLLASSASAVRDCRRRAGTCLGLDDFSPDALVLVGVYVDPRWREMGVGRDLVRGLAARAAGRGVAAIEASASWPPRLSRAASCAQPPSRWLQAVGFRLVRERPFDPRWRLDLATTVRWRPALSRAWQRISDAMRPAPTAEPAHRERPARVPTG